MHLQVLSMQYVIGLRGYWPKWQYFQGFHNVWSTISNIYRISKRLKGLIWDRLDASRRLLLSMNVVRRLQESLNCRGRDLNEIFSLSKWLGYGFHGYFQTLSSNEIESICTWDAQVMGKDPKIERELPTGLQCRNEPLFGLFVYIRIHSMVRNNSASPLIEELSIA